MIYYLGDQKASSFQKYFIQYNKYSTATWLLIIPYDINGSVKNATADFIIKTGKNYFSSS